MWLLVITLINLLTLAAFVLLWPEYPEAAIATAVLFGLVLIWLLHQEAKSRRLIIEKLTSGFASLKDNDFAVSLPQEKKPQHKELIEQFNLVVEALRKERQGLYQRELLLDKMVNASNVVSVLLNHRQQLVYLNQAAKTFFDNNNDVLGLEWQVAVEPLQSELRDLPDKSSAIVSLADENQVEQDWLLSTHQFRLHGANHKLVLLKPITNELQAQETQVWKKVIRVINHELNNSLAPISSMCHSGNILAGQMEHPQLNKVFETISNRISKLSEFIDSYSRLARISQPQRQSFDLLTSLSSIKALYNFELVTIESKLTITADPSQLEQVFINLVKNALEANQAEAATEEIKVQVTCTSTHLITQVIDTGTGMNEQQLLQAFLPSFSTKVNGSGIGLAVCKEIIENHGGHIELLNNIGKGMTVEVTLPR